MEDYGYPPVFPDDTEEIRAAGEDVTTEVELIKKPPKKVYISLA